MEKNLIEDLGENYEYLRVIITNKLKLKQIAAMEVGSNIAAIVALIMILMVIGVALLVGLFALGTLLLMHSFSSAVAVAIMIGVYLLLGLLIIVARKPLIVRPILRIMNEMIPID